MTQDHQPKRINHSEGLGWMGRLAHKQQQIGEASMRIKTTSERPILMLKLTKDKHEQLEMWRR